MKKRVLIAGYYGFGNAGDEAILSATVSGLHQRLPDVTISVVTAAPEQTRIHHAVDTVPWRDMKALIAAVRDTDCVILGGGGLFQDYLEFRPETILTRGAEGVTAYAQYIYLAALLGKPCMLHAVGIGPLINPDARELTRICFALSSAATVRDAASADIAQQLGVRIRPVVGADPAYSLEFASSQSRRSYLDDIAGRRLDRPVVGVSLRPWTLSPHPATWMDMCARALDDFASATGGTIVFIPMQELETSYTDDVAVCEYVRRQMSPATPSLILTQGMPFRTRTNLIGGCDIVLGMRLHSLILAATAGIPMVGLDYDPKVRLAMQQVGQNQYCLDLETLTASALSRTLLEAYERKSSIAEQLAVSIPPLRAASERLLDIAAQFVANVTTEAPVSERQWDEVLRHLVISRTILVDDLTTAQQELMKQHRQDIEAWQARTAEVESELRGQRIVAEALEVDVASLTKQLSEQDAVLTKQLSEQDAVLTKQLSEHNAVVADRDLQIRQLAAERLDLTNELDRIWRSKGYQILRRFWWVRRVMARLTLGSIKRTYKLVIPRSLRIAIWQYRHTRREARVVANQVTRTVLSAPRSEDGAGQIEGLLSDSRTVNLVVPTFFNFQGYDMFCGGAERYLIELCKILRERGYDPQVYQSATSPWVRHYHDIAVHGIETSGDSTLLNHLFHDQVSPGRFTIYFAFFLATPHHHHPNVGISHGVFWDHAVYQSSSQIDQSQLDQLQSALSNCDHLVSVDTNTINWVRASVIGEAAKFTYIPNFVDTQVYAPGPRTRESSSRLVILYPRRLYRPRGFWLVADIIPFFMEAYPNTEFHFVGKADEAEAAKVREMSEHYPGRIQHYNLLPESMHEAYQEADITLIPTTASEGTSLSCLEAMASGNAVIATNVGGLPDLVIDGYNGLLIEPDAEALKEAIERLVLDHDLRRTLQLNGRRVSQSFDQQTWQNRWMRLFDEFLPPVEPPTVSSARSRVFVYPRTQGISWSTMQQRPHHLMRALAGLGHYAYFVSDSIEDSPHTHDHLQVVDPRHELYVSRPVLLIHYAYNFRQIHEYTQPVVIYDILDAPEIHSQQPLEQGRPSDDNYLYYHQRLLEEADIVTVSSQDLYDRFCVVRPDIKLVRNGVTVEDFQGRELRRPADLPVEKRPIIGYYGALAEWFDFDLLETLCKLRPSYNFVLIGVTTQADRLERLSRKYQNLSYLGEKPYAELPAYLKQFSAAIIPFVLSDVTDATSPLKLFEYAAGRVPIVTTAMRECQRYDVVMIGESPEDFASKLDVAVKLKGDPELLKRLDALARSNSWQDRAERILAALDERRCSTVLKQDEETANT